MKRVYMDISEETHDRLRAASYQLRKPIKKILEEYVKEISETLGNPTSKKGGKKP